MAVDDSDEAAAWRELFGSSTLRDAEFETMSGVPLEPVYSPRGSPWKDGARGQGAAVDRGSEAGARPPEGADAGAPLPGLYPYTRGPHASMYRSKLWTMRLFAGFGTAEDTNVRFRELLRSGSDGLSVAFDLPTLMGRDSDDLLAEGEVGRCGVAVDTLADVRDLFRGIDLGDVTTSMTINSPAAILLAMYVAAAQEAGVPSHRLGGTIQNDILKEYQAQKEYVFPPRPSMRIVTDMIRYCSADMPAIPCRLSLRLPHPRGRLDSCPGARVHDRERLCLCRGSHRCRPEGR